MIRDALSELHQAAGVEIIKKVGSILGLSVGHLMLDHDQGYGCSERRKFQRSWECSQ